MTHVNQRHRIQKGSLSKRMLAGALINLVLIGFFLISADEPNPSWGKFWFIKPLIMVPVAGAAGGAFYYFITSKFRSGWQRLIAILLSIIVYVFILWIGTVLGLNGTYWD